MITSSSRVKQNVERKCCRDTKIGGKEVVT